MGIVCESLGVRVGAELSVFDGVDLSVGPGQCAVVVGPNGSGKSTLLRCLYGMRPPTSGTVRVAGRRPDERSLALRRKVSVLLDDSACFPECSPLQHLELLASSFGVDLPDAREVLAEGGLLERAHVAAGQLSAGQRRRLLLLGATARPYEVLLLDEPERALDAAGREWLARLIRRASESGAATVVATHHPALLEAADVVLDLT